MKIRKYTDRAFLIFLRLSLLKEFMVSFANGTLQDITDTETCENRPPATARVGGIRKLINDDNFKRYQGSYPPGVDLEDNGVPFYVLDASKSILYVPNFLNETTCTELKDFCVDGERFTRSPIRGYGINPGVAESNARTR